VVYALRHAPARTRHGIWLLASVKFLLPLSLLAVAGAYVGEWLAPADSQWTAAARWLDRSLTRWSVTITPANADFGWPWLATAGAAWLAGTIGVAFRRYRQWQQVRRLIRGAAPLDQGREVDALRRVLSHTTQLRSVLLLQTASLVEPGVTGLRRPMLLWPAGLTERLNDDQLEAIMAHEICHLERRDNLIAIVQMLVETVFWFHPAVWWVGARIIAERERACDEAVVRSGADRESYAEGILKVCGFCLRSPLATVSGVGGGHLTDRIERIMTRAHGSPLTLRMRVLLASLVAAIAVMPVASGLASAHRPSAETLAQDDAKPYRPGKDITNPVLVKEVRPRYTPEAMRAKIQGRVLLQVVVLANGNVGDVKVTKSLDTVYGLDEQAVKAAKQWQFKPGTKDKKPVPVQVDLEMTFKLK
jgi:TonB family protein